MDIIFDYIKSGFVFLLIFTVLIYVHELGHYLACRISGIRVEEFGFGLPPRIWGKKIGKTIWSINWIPLGGFVMPYGEDRSDEKIKKEKDSFPHASYLKQFFVVVAGVCMNFLFAFLILFFMFIIGFKPMHIAESDKDTIHFGDNSYTILTKEKAKEKGMLIEKKMNGVMVLLTKDEEKETVFKLGDKIKKIDEKSIKNIKDVIKIIDDKTEKEEIKILVERIKKDCEKDCTEEDAEEKEIVASFSDLEKIVGIKVLKVLDNSKAKGILKKDDLIKKIDGNLVYDTKNFTKYKGNTTEEKTFEILRDGKLISKEIKITKNKEIGIAIMAKSIDSSIKFKKLESKNIPDAFTLASKETFLLTKGHFSFVRDLITEFSKNKESIGGPVAIASATHKIREEAENTNDFTNLFFFALFLSVSLGVMNILPFPALDGGRIIFIIYAGAYEAITKKQANRKVEEKINAVGLFLLFALIFLVTVKDIIKIWE